MEVAPFFSEIADGPEGGAAHWLKTSDGLRIRVGHWPLDGAKGTVLIFPGRTEFVEKYGLTARGLRARGYASLAIDWRGQGLADRVLTQRDVGHVGAFSEYQNDVSAVMDHARALGLPEPYYMIAHSMGGCIGLRAILNGLPVRAVMFSAPMWGMQLSGALRAAAWGVSTLSRHLGFSHALAPGQALMSYVLRTPFAGNTLTNDADMFSAMQAQLHAQPDLGLGGPSLQWINASLRETAALSREASPNLPCLTYLGGREAIVDPAPIRARMAQWPGGSLRFIPEGQHEMLMDNAALRDMILDETVALFSAHP